MVHYEILINMQMCTALYSAGYIFTRPISEKSIILFSSNPELNATEIRLMTFLECHISTASTELISGKCLLSDQQFQSAFLRAVYMSILAQPQWNCFQYNEQLEGVIMKYDEELQNTQPNMKPIIIVSFVGLSQCGDGMYIQQYIILISKNFV